MQLTVMSLSTEIQKVPKPISDTFSHQSSMAIVTIDS